MNLFPILESEIIPLHPIVLHTIHIVAILSFSLCLLSMFSHYCSYCSIRSLINRDSQTISNPIRGSDKVTETRRVTIEKLNNFFSFWKCAQFGLPQETRKPVTYFKNIKKSINYKTRRIRHTSKISSCLLAIREV